MRNTVVGSYAYISPEQFSNSPYDDKIDSWSVGVLTYEMLIGRPPYEEQLHQMALKGVVEASV
jgi:aurora kinase